jgi:FMN reductase
MSSAIVVGNPKARSKTYDAANLVIDKLTGSAADQTFDLADFGPGLLDWGSTEVAAAVAAITATDLVVFASPTYKATYTGLLKLFLDRFGGGSLTRTTAVPLMLGGHWRHSLAADVLLKPVLVEIGATCPTRGLFLLDSDYSESAELESWLEESRGRITRSLAS